MRARSSCECSSSSGGSMCTTQPSRPSSRWTQCQPTCPGRSLQPWKPCVPSTWQVSFWWWACFCLLEKEGYICSFHKGIQKACAMHEQTGRGETPKKKDRNLRNIQTIVLQLSVTFCRLLTLPDAMPDVPTATGIKQAWACQQGSSRSCQEFDAMTVLHTNEWRDACSLVANFILGDWWLISASMWNCAGCPMLS